MEKSLFEQMGGTYTQVGDYLLPNITLPPQDSISIGIWGQRHARYLKQHRKVLYMNLLASGKLSSYLADINQQAEKMFSRLVNEMADKQGVTEQLKASEPMLWVGRMKAIRNTAMEVVNSEVIFVVNANIKVSHLAGVRS